MARRTSSRRKLEAFAQGVHYVRAAAENRRRATKRAIRARELRWEDNVHGKSAYIVDSVTGFASKNLAMFIREIPPGAATGTHHHNFEAVAYVLEGRGHDVHDGRPVRWRAGDGLYIPPMVSHQHVNDDPEKSAWLLFIANWPLLNHLGITTFVQTGEAHRPRRTRMAAHARRDGRSGRARTGRSARMDRRSGRARSARQRRR
jgi:gentisate 1,2-dioxygenase